MLRKLCICFMDDKNGCIYSILLNIPNAYLHVIQLGIKIG